MKKLTIVIRFLFIFTFFLMPHCTNPHQICNTYIELNTYIVNSTLNTIDVAIVCDTGYYDLDLNDTIRTKVPADTSILIKLNFPIYVVSKSDESSLNISCDDKSSILDLERKLIINDLNVNILNMSYQDFITKTGNKYTYRLGDNLCKSGSSNIGWLIIPGCGNTISVSDTFIYK